MISLRLFLSSKNGKTKTRIISRTRKQIKTKKMTQITEWKKAPHSNLSLAYRERIINREEDQASKEYWEEQGLERQFPSMFVPGEVFYDTIATTEQRSILDQEFTIITINSPGGVSGAIEETYVTYRFEDNPDEFLGGV